MNPIGKNELTEGDEGIRSFQEDITVLPDTPLCMNTVINVLPQPV